ncbi:MAG TPA: mersacidin/lichenicidin family type 2 lantibiotic [Candidatus Acidoferrum sp.]|nr:mersacidin/lichenicidin family type 2 lantibiotic [Candidatus Acidoferrum sp.]
MTVDIVRAWKDPEYHKTLTPEELASLPPHPAGFAELTDEELTRIAGGRMIAGWTRIDDTCKCIPPHP